MARILNVFMLCLAVASLSACYSYQPQTEDVKAIDGMKNKRLAREVAMVFWEQTRDYPRNEARKGFAPSGLEAIYVAKDPHNPDELEQVGWIEYLKNESGANYARYYDRDWNIVAYTTLDETLIDAKTGRELVGGQKFSAAEATKIVYNVQSFYGWDDKRYDDTTILRTVENWAVLSPDERGLTMKHLPKITATRELKGREMSRILTTLDRETFYAAEARKQEEFRLKRAGGELTEWDTRVSESPYAKKK